MVLDQPRICHAFLKHHLKRTRGSGVAVDDEDLAQTPNPGSVLEDEEWEELRAHAFGDGSNKVEICGLPMEVLKTTLVDGAEHQWWYCPSCDRRDAPELQTA